MTKKTRATLTMATIGVLLLILAIVIVAMAPFGKPIYWLVRGAAMVGYVCVFLTVLSTAYLREMTRLVGRPFLWAHHVLATAGLVLIFVHPVLLAIASGSAKVFVPVTSSWSAFWLNGGRPALYLFVVAVSAARFRRQWRRSWRMLHGLNYVAFGLATVHSVLIGTDFGGPLLRWLPIAMGVLVVAVFAKKRLLQRARAARS